MLQRSNSRNRWIKESPKRGIFGSFSETVRPRRRLYICQSSLFWIKRVCVFFMCLRFLKKSVLKLLDHTVYERWKSDDFIVNINNASVFERTSWHKRQCFWILFWRCTVRNSAGAQIILIEIDWPQSQQVRIVTEVRLWPLPATVLQINFHYNYTAIVYHNSWNTNRVFK